MQVLDSLLTRGSGTLARLGASESGDTPVCDRIWPLDGGWLARARVDGRLDGDSWALLRPGGKLPRSLRRLHQEGRAVWLLEIGALAWRLRDDPVVGAAALGRLRPSSCRADPAKYRDLRARLISYKPMRRAVVRYRDRSGKRIAYVKHLRDGSAARLAERHAVLGDWARTVGTFEVARLTDLALRPDTLTWSPAAGRPLARALASSPQRSDVLLDRVGRAIGGFHLCPVGLSTRHTREDELETLDRWIAVAAPLLACPKALREAAARLRRHSHRLDRHRGVVSHRDLHDAQILVNENTLTLLDIDTCALAEPELDLGNLLAHLDHLDGRQASVAFEEALVAAYSEVAGSVPDRRRLRWYRAAAAIRIACVHACRGGSVEDFARWAGDQTRSLGSAEGTSGRGAEPWRKSG